MESRQIKATKGYIIANGNSNRKVENKGGEVCMRGWLAGFRAVEATPSKPR